MPESRNKARNPLQQLLETEEKGRGLALFGWAGVTVFAFLAAFASWQFAPARTTSTHLASLDGMATGDITGGIKPTSRTSPGKVPTVPTPLADDTSSKSDIEQLRADLKDLRRMVGRIDVSTDVLARRISNLEDSIGSSSSAALKPDKLQALTPITPVTPAKPAATAEKPPVANTSPPAADKPAPTPPVATTTPMPPQPGNTVPQNTQPPHPMTTPLPPPGTPASDKSALDRSAVDRSTLERMLLQRAQGLDSDTAENNSFIPPLPDPVSVIPKSRPPLVLPPQPIPVLPPAPMAKAEPKPDAKPLADAPTTGSVTPRPVMPIDPTKAVVVPASPPPEPAKTVMASPKPVTAATPMSPEDQKAAAEKMALAMRQDPPAEQKPVDVPKPVEPMGIDLGGYRSIGQVKKVWSDLEMRQGKLTKAFTPLARLGEANDGVEIRLVLGPFTDKEQALRTCRQLRGATARCDTVAYTGEPVIGKTPEVEHRPAPAPAAPAVKRQPLKFDLPKQPVPAIDPVAPQP